MPPFAVRLMLAIFLWFLGWWISFSGLFVIAWILWIGIYFYPTIEASIRDSEHLLPIGMLNLFLGWTLVGWVAALVWAVVAKEKRQGPLPVVKPQPYAVTSGVANYQPTLPEQPQEDAVKTRACPFCAEEILKAAIICKHCRSDVSEKDQT